MSLVAVVLVFADSILIEGVVIFFSRDCRGCVRSSHLIAIVFLLPIRAVLDSVSSTRFHSLLACVVMVSFVEHAVADECCLICHSWQPSWVSQIHFSSKYVQFDLAAFISGDCRLLIPRLYFHRILLLSHVLHLLMLSFSRWRQ